MISKFSHSLISHCHHLMRKLTMHFSNYIVTLSSNYSCTFHFSLINPESIFVQIAIKDKRKRALIPQYLKKLKNHMAFYTIMPATLWYGQLMLLFINQYFTSSSKKKLVLHKQIFSRVKPRWYRSVYISILVGQASLSRLHLQ